MKLTTATGSVAGLLGFSGQALTAWAYYNDPAGPIPLGPAELTFLDDKSIRSFNGGVCVNNFLDEKGKELLKKGHQLTFDSGTSLNNEFANIRERAEGCVAISWIKETGKEGYFKAKVRYEWVFTVGDESLVTYGLFNPEEQLHKIIGKTAYINRKNDKIAGLVRYIEKNHAPLKPGKADEYGGFKIGEISNYGRLCKYSVRCVDDPEKRISDEEKGTWEENENGQKNFSDWTKNFGTAFDHIVNNEYHNLTKFKTFVNLKSGTGTKR